MFGFFLFFQSWSFSFGWCIYTSPSAHHVDWFCNLFNERKFMCFIFSYSIVEEKKLALKSCITFTQNWLESTEEVTLSFFLLNLEKKIVGVNWLIMSNFFSCFLWILLNSSPIKAISSEMTTCVTNKNAADNFSPPFPNHPLPPPPQKKKISGSAIICLL